MVAKFAQVDALPGAQIQASVSDWNREGGSHESTFGMSRHIVGAFQSVEKIGLIFGHDMVEDGIEVAPHIGITVFPCQEAIGTYD